MSFFAIVAVVAVCGWAFSTWGWRQALKGWERANNATAEALELAESYRFHDDEGQR